MAKQIAIKGKSLIDGNGGAPIADPVILLDGKRITAIGSKDKVKIPNGVEVVDASHCTLMPGMMDLHIHLCMFNNRTFKNYRVAQWEVTPHLQQMYAFFHAQLCFEMGFTTLRDLGLQSTRGLMTESMCAVRDAIEAGVLAGPRLIVAGFFETCLEIGRHFCRGPEVFGNVVARGCGLFHRDLYRFRASRWAVLISADCVRLSPPARRTTTSRPCRVKYTRYPGP